MKKNFCFILCILFAGCSYLKQLPHPVFPGINPDKTGGVDRRSGNECSVNSEQSASTPDQDVLIESPAILPLNPANETLQPDSLTSKTDAPKNETICFPVKKKWQGDAENAADLDIILIITVIILLVIGLLTGGTLLLIAGLAATTWWMIILAGVLFYMGICCLLGFIALAFGDRHRPSEAYR